MMTMVFAVGAREDDGHLRFRTVRRIALTKATQILERPIVERWELRWAVCRTVWLVSFPPHNYASLMVLVGIPAAGFILA